MTVFNPKFTITNRMTEAITQIERARGFIEAARLSDDWVRDMGSQALIKEAHHTTHIEGTRLTLDQAERLWRGEAVPEADPDDTRELLNYRSAFEFVSECLDSGDPITEGMIREIHRKLVEGVRGGKAAPGAYRRIQNYVANSETGEVIYTPPSAVEIPIMMSEMVKWLNSDLEIHPVLVSGVAQFQLVHIHPFLDGNGRIGRLLISLQLIEKMFLKYPVLYISDFFETHRQSYYDSLDRVRKNDDLEQWILFFLEGVSKTAKKSKRTFKDIIILRGRFEEKISTLGRKTENGRKLLMYLFSNPVISIKEIEKILDIQYVAANNLVQDFVGLGILKEKTGFSRNRIFMMNDYINLFRK